jgi:ammonia channel protein AmtB
MFQNVGAEVYTTPAGNVLGGATIPLALFALFQMKFAIITPSLITGSFAERVRFSAYMFFMMFFFFVIYCPLAHMTWHPEGLIAGTWDGFVIFLYHLLAIVIVFVYTFAMSWAGYKLIDSLIPMRVSEYSEKVGLDFSQHDEHYGLAHIGERELAEYEEHIREKNK